MKKSIQNYLFILLFASVNLTAQEKFPIPDKPSSWVNDYASILSPAQEQQLDQKLNRFQYQSSTQIFVVTIDDNSGYAASDLAPRIGELWGVGQQGKDNGIIMLVDIMDRQVFIATGYGLEEFIPDAIAIRIVTHTILPKFKESDYYAGITDGIDVITSLLEGKFSPEEYKQETSSSKGSSLIGIIFIIIIFITIFGNRRRSVGMGRSNLPLWIALGMMSSGSRHSGSFGNFSSGSGGFGGGFGGFSGGGGGSFGGGGAGGGW